MITDILVDEALQALKDILNAADNGLPYDVNELEDIIRPILDEAYEQGIRLNGEVA